MIDAFTQAYLECALWSTNDNATDDGGEPLDANYTIDDFEPDTLAVMIEDCTAFQASHGEHYTDSAQAGHDFWLTREGHGAGFWDGDYPEPEATLLTDASKAFGGFDLMVSDGMIHGATFQACPRDRAPQGAPTGEVWIKRPQNTYTVTQHGDHYATWNAAKERWEA